LLQKLRNLYEEVCIYQYTKSGTRKASCRRGIVEQYH
jgi:hypothetical protein